MNTKKILADEISDITVASLPTRPTAPTAFGGRGYTSKDIKSAFDKLPLFIIERFNSLLDDISSEDENSIANAIPTGLQNEHTLKDLFYDITNGMLATYLVAVDDLTLDEYLLSLKEKENELETQVSFCLLHIADKAIDASRPSDRDPITGEVNL